jgi:hypothetical protein
MEKIATLVRVHVCAGCVCVREWSAVECGTHSENRAMKMTYGFTFLL